MIPPIAEVESVKYVISFKQTSANPKLTDGASISSITKLSLIAAQTPLFSVMNVSVTLLEAVSIDPGKYCEFKTVESGRKDPSPFVIQYPCPVLLVLAILIAPPFRQAVSDDITANSNGS